jgi:hypothetical protein
MVNYVASTIHVDRILGLRLVVANQHSEEGVVSTLDVDAQRRYVQHMLDANDEEGVYCSDGGLLVAARCTYAVHGRVHFV